MRRSASATTPTATPALGRRGAGFDPTIFSDFGDILGDFFGFGDVFGRRARRAAPRLRPALQPRARLRRGGLRHGEQHPDPARREPCATCQGSGAAPGTSPTTCPSCGGRGPGHVPAGLLQRGPHLRTLPRHRPHGGHAVQGLPRRGAGRRRAQAADQDPGRRRHGQPAAHQRRRRGRHRAAAPRATSTSWSASRSTRSSSARARPSSARCRSASRRRRSARPSRCPRSTAARPRSSIPEGTQTGTTFRVRGQGVPHLGGRGRGDLHVTVRVVVPTKLTAEQRKLIDQLGKTLPSRRAGEGPFLPRQGEGHPPGPQGLKAFRVPARATTRTTPSARAVGAGNGGHRRRASRTAERRPRLLRATARPAPTTCAARSRPVPGVAIETARGPRRGLGGAVPRGLPAFAPARSGSSPPGKPAHAAGAGRRRDRGGPGPRLRHRHPREHAPVPGRPGRRARARPARPRPRRGHGQRHPGRGRGPLGAPRSWSAWTSTRRRCSGAPPCRAEPRAIAPRPRRRRARRSRAAAFDSSWRTSSRRSCVERARGAARACARPAAQLVLSGLLAEDLPRGARRLCAARGDIDVRDRGRVGRPRGGGRP